MSYQSYELLPLFLKNKSNTYTICKIGDGVWSVCGFLQCNADDERDDFFTIKELLETPEGHHADVLGMGKCCGILHHIHYKYTLFRHPVARAFSYAGSKHP
jgi:hypothetical protein